LSCHKRVFASVDQLHAERGTYPKQPDVTVAKRARTIVVDMNILRLDRQVSAPSSRESFHSHCLARHSWKRCGK
jgi:hypothetical protein